MTPKESFLSPNAIFYSLIMSMWPWISLERESCWRWSLRTSSSQCHNNLVLVPPRKPSDPVKGIYEGYIYDLKTRVDVWTRMDMVPVEYGTFGQTCHLTMWFFQFITRINYKWDYVIGRSVALMVLQTFKYPTWLTFKIIQGCHQLNIWRNIDMLPVKYPEVILGL